MFHNVISMFRKKDKLSICKDERKELNFVKEEVSHEIMSSAFFKKFLAILLE